MRRNGPTLPQSARGRRSELHQLVEVCGHLIEDQTSEPVAGITLSWHDEGQDEITQRKAHRLCFFLAYHWLPRPGPGLVIGCPDSEHGLVHLMDDEPNKDDSRVDVKCEEIVASVARATGAASAGEVVGDLQIWTCLPVCDSTDAGHVNAPFAATHPYGTGSDSPLCRAPILLGRLFKARQKG